MLASRPMGAAQPPFVFRLKIKTIVTARLFSARCGVTSKQAASGHVGEGERCHAPHPLPIWAPPSAFPGTTWARRAERLPLPLASTKQRGDAGPRGLLRTVPAAQLLRPGQDGLHDGLRGRHGGGRAVRHLLGTQDGAAEPRAHRRHRQDHAQQRRNFWHLHGHRHGNPVLMAWPSPSATNQCYRLLEAPEAV